ncbi:dTDP-4-dehydrorhamnose reductase [Chlamydiota bacterium]
MKRVLVIGADGQLGSDVCSVLEAEHEVLPYTIKDIDVSDEKTCNKIASLKPDILINTAAYHNVPKCEENPVRSFEVNAIGALNLAKVCSENNIAMVHISTDYVFDGEKKAPYIETDCPKPLNSYAISKVAGESFIQYKWEKHFIIRTSGLYGEHKCMEKERNFPETMVYLYKQGKELKVVDDEYLTPTYTRDLAKQIKELIKTEKYGLYHITNNGSCSWYEFAVKLFELLEIDVKIKPIPASTFPSPVLRPGYSVLDNFNLRNIGLDKMRLWEEALTDYLSKKSILS